jgi:hypothetical protein
VLIVLTADTAAAFASMKSANTKSFYISTAFMSSSTVLCLASGLRVHVRVSMYIVPRVQELIRVLDATAKQNHDLKLLVIWLLILLRVALCTGESTYAKCCYYPLS